jgi:hypothetical protein
VSKKIKKKSIGDRLDERFSLYDGIKVVGELISEIGRGASRDARGLICITLPYVPVYGWFGHMQPTWFCWTVVLASQGMATWAITTRRSSGKSKFDNSG